MSKIAKRHTRFSYRHLGRYGEIVAVLVKYGFGDLLSRLSIDKYVKAGKRLFRKTTQVDIPNISRWDRVRMALEELGPSFVKLGQFASNRPDILPADLITALEKLQDAVPPFPGSEAEAIIEKELGVPVGQAFAEFSTEPFASASMAQVHRARLPEGQEVAVKVLRPQIADIVAVDIDIMHHIGSLMQRHIHGLGVFEPEKLVDEFAHAIRKELDFQIEAMHIRHFAHNFRNDPTVYFPQVYQSHSARRVLTTEYINGIKVSRLEDLLQAGIDPKKIARRGALAVLRQIYVHGFFHADPHAGNILIKDDHVICFLDLGMTGILAPTTRARLSSIIIGVAQQNPQRIVTALAAMSYRQLQNREELEYQVSELIQEYASRSIASINISEIFNRLSQLMAVHQIRVMPGFYLLVKAIVTIEGIGYRLDPSFNMIEYVSPFARKMIREQYNIPHMLHDGTEAVGDLVRLLRDLPSETRELLQIIKAGQVKIEFEHRGLDPITRKFDQVINRLVFGLVLASLIIGSSIVILSDIPPKLHGLPVIGLGGFLTAGIMGFWLLISILRHERM